jgi:hypothetical protein
MPRHLARGDDGRPSICSATNPCTSSLSRVSAQNPSKPSDRSVVTSRWIQPQGSRRRRRVPLAIGDSYYRAIGRLAFGGGGTTTVNKQGQQEPSRAVEWTKTLPSSAALMSAVRIVADRTAGHARRRILNQLSWKSTSRLAGLAGLAGEQLHATPAVPLRAKDPWGGAVADRATSRYAATFSGAGSYALAAAWQGPLGRGLSAGAQTVYLAVPNAYRVASYTPQGIRVATVRNRDPYVSSPGDVVERSSRAHATIGVP